MDGLSHLPIEAAPPKGEKAALLVQTLPFEEVAWQAAQELHRATHVRGDALWKFFRDHFSFTGGKKNCLEVARSCVQCQAGTDYGDMRKTAGTITIMSTGPSDTLSVDIVGPLLADRNMEYIITFVDCYTKYAILIPLKDHTAQTVSNALLDHVIPYFGVTNGDSCQIGARNSQDKCGTRCLGP